jgi:lactate permease
VYRPTLDPVADSLALSALVAGLPIVTLFLLLGILRVRAWVAALGALAVALLVSIVAYSMTPGQALLAASQGATFALFPLAWTFVTAIWIYRMTVVGGHFDVLRRSFSRISDDEHVQAMVIAFCFGSLLEGLAGQGTPVAITTVMLLALGFHPLKAATVALVANTVPAAFGPLGLPITTLAGVTGLPADELGAMAGRQVPVIALVIPLLLVGIVGGRRGLHRTWHVAAACGGSFALAQFITSNYFSVALADIVAALVSGVVVAATTRTWPPRCGDDQAIDAESPDERTWLRPTTEPNVPGSGQIGAVALAGGTTVERAQPDAPNEVWRAHAPYLVIVAIFGLSQVPAIASTLNAATVTVDWPGLRLLTASGEPSSLSVFRLNWLSSTGTLLVLAGLVTMVILRVTLRDALVSYGQTLASLRWAILTVCGLLALAFVMNGSGQTATLGTWMAGAGGLFALLSPVLGWLGVALTGSDTSSNSLFGALQVSAAERAGLDPVLLAAANASGGVVGKMISLQNLTIAASAAGLSGREADLFRRMFGWSVLLICAMALLVGLQATPVLSWMVP